MDNKKQPQKIKANPQDCNCFFAFFFTKKEVAFFGSFLATQKRTDKNISNNKILYQN